MHVLSLALGGCLRGEPVRYGITEDTGGHITYILGEMAALAARPDIAMAEIVTRRFEAPQLGAIHAQAVERIGPKLIIRRIDSGNADYLAKEALAADRDGFTRALIADLRSRDRLPDIIHAHFADAADVAARVEEALGIPFIYTAHSLGTDKQAALGDACPGLRARLAEEDRAIAAASAIIGSSRDECERQLSSYPAARAERIHRVVPGTSTPDVSSQDMAGAAELVAPFLRDAGKPMVLAVARPVRKKNLVTLVEAFASQPGLRDRANLVLLAGQRSGISDGEEEQVEVLGELIDAIDRHDLHGHVAYPRRHTRAQVDAFYALAAKSGGVFVNPALVEPYGLTIVEAATHGLPVLATRIGGPRDIVAELGHGELIDPRDAPTLGRAITALLDDKPRWQEYSESGRNSAAGMTWSRYADEFASIAGDVLANGRSRSETRTRHAVSSLLVSDIDNTLTGCRDGVERLRGFLARHRDFALVAATGRSISEARRLFRLWNLPRPAAWITSVGSEIYLEAAAGTQFDADYAAGIAPGWKPDAIAALLDGVPGLEPQADYEQRSFKLSYLTATPALARKVKRVLREAGLPAHVVHSHDRLLDVLPARAGKGAAMAHVARNLGVTPERVFASGDSGNDRDMLLACRNAVVVANFSDELQSIVDRPNVYVARRQNAGGVLEGVIAHRLRARQQVRSTLATGQAGRL